MFFRSAAAPLPLGCHPRPVAFEVRNLESTGMNGIVVQMTSDRLIEDALCVGRPIECQVDLGKVAVIDRGLGIETERDDAVLEGLLVRAGVAVDGTQIR